MKSTQVHKELSPHSRLLIVVVGDHEFRKSSLKTLLEDQWYFDESIDGLIAIEIPTPYAGVKFVENIGMETEIESGETSLERLKSFVSEPLARIIVCALPDLTVLNDYQNQIDLGNFSIEISTNQADDLFADKDKVGLTITATTESCIVDLLKKSIEAFAAPRGLLIWAMAY